MRTVIVQYVTFEDDVRHEGSPSTADDSAVQLPRQLKTSSMGSSVEEACEWDRLCQLTLSGGRVSYTIVVPL